MKNSMPKGRRRSEVRWWQGVEPMDQFMVAVLAILVLPHVILLCVLAMVWVMAQWFGLL